MVGAIFQTVTTVITQFLTSLSTAFTGITSLFYNEEQLTFLGTMLLIGAGVGLVYWVFYVIMRLVRIDIK